MARVAARGWAAMRAARSTVSSSTRPGALTCRARPSSTNSCAPTQSEVSRTRAARCQPMAAGNRRLLAASGGTPSSAKGTRRRAPASTSTRSQCGQQGEAEPDGHAVDRGEEGDREVVDAVEQAHEALPGAIDGGAGGDGSHLAQVLARREGGPRPVSTTAPTASSASARPQGARDLLVHRGVEGIAHLGAVERDSQHARRDVLGLDAVHGPAHCFTTVELPLPAMHPWSRRPPFAPRPYRGGARPANIWPVTLGVALPLATTGSSRGRRGVGRPGRAGRRGPTVRRGRGARRRPAVRRAAPGQVTVTPRSTKGRAQRPHSASAKHRTARTATSWPATDSTRARWRRAASRRWLRSWSLTTRVLRPASRPGRRARRTRPR